MGDGGWPGDDWAECEHAGDGCPYDCPCDCDPCLALQAVLRGDPEGEHDDD